MKVFCTNSQCVITNPDTIASGACNFFVAEFIFDEAWNTLAKYIIFQNIDDGSKKEIELIGNSCSIPSEVLFNQGNIYIGVLGVKNNINGERKIILTTNMAFACTLLQGPNSELISTL